MPQSRQLAAIMFTDIVGYTALMGNDEQKAFDLLNKNRQIQKPIIEQYNGRWIKELGDGVMASFNTVSDAVSAAIKIQEACNAAKDFQLRIGIHLGEVVFENDDVFGDGVNIAARIQALATPGGIWISEPVHNNVVNKNDINSEFVKVEHLKNVKEPVRIYQVKAVGVISTKTVHSFAEKINVPGSKRPKLRISVLLLTGMVLILVAGYFIYSHFQKPGNDINSLTTGEVAYKSIAVLPFVDMSPAKDQEYLGDGLADEIINSITAINNLNVIGRTSSFQYKGKGLDAQTIGEKLNVSNVLEGSIQKDGDNLRITVSLLSVKDNINIWSQRFDKKLKDIFSIQDSITSNIVQKLKITLLESEKPRLIKKETSDEVYTQYLKGLYTYKEHANEKSIEYNLKAIEIDSTFAPSYAYIALAKIWIINNVHNFDDHDAISEAKGYANKAIQLDPTLAEGYSALALLAWSIDLDFAEAKVNFEKSLQLNPSASLIKNRYGYFLLWMGDFDKAILLAEEAIKSDPGDYNGYAIVSTASIYKKKFSEAEKYIAEGKELFPDNKSFNYLYLENKFYSGEYDQFIQSAKLLIAKDSSLESDDLLSLLSIAYLKKGDRAESNTLFQQLKNKVGNKNSSINYCLARIYLQYQVKDSCFASLEKSFNNHESMFYFFKIDPLFQFIRQDQRYIQLYHQYGFDRYQ